MGLIQFAGIHSARCLERSNNLCTPNPSKTVPKGGAIVQQIWPRKIYFGSPDDDDRSSLRVGNGKGAMQI